MANGVLFAFMGFEALFVIGGIIILVVALLARAALNSKQTLDNVAHNLLLSQGPLTGLSQIPLQLEFNRLINHSSRNCQCRPRLRNLPHLHPLHRRTHKSNFPQSPWVCRHLLRNLHTRCRPQYLVSNP